MDSKYNGAFTSRGLALLLADDPWVASQSETRFQTQLGGHYDKRSTYRTRRRDVCCLRAGAARERGLGETFVPRIRESNHDRSMDAKRPAN